MINRLACLLMLLGTVAQASSHTNTRSQALKEEQFFEHFDSDHLPTLAGHIARIADQFRERDDFNGSVLVSREGQTLFAGYFGWQDLKREIPNSASTRHRLGSIGKQFTASAIMLLQQDGKLDVDDTVAEHLPDFDWKPARRVTLTQLLRHTSGAPRSVLDYVRGGIEKRYQLQELLRAMEKTKLEYEPGERFQYSNAGYTILAGIVTAVSGVSYEDFLRKRVFEPAGMTETHFDFPEFAIAEDAVGYHRSTSDKLRVDRKISMSFAIGAGTFRTTPADLVRWDTALRAGAILSAESQALMYTPTTASESYGFGWTVGSYRRPSGEGDGMLVKHGGGIEGFSTTLVRLVDDGIVIAIMANCRNTPCDDFAEEIQTAVEIDERPSGVDRVQLALATGGSTAAEAVIAGLDRNERGLFCTADQILGEADAFTQASWGNCWFPEDRKGQDVVNLGFGRAVQAARVEIHGTQNHDGLTEILLRDSATGIWHAVATGQPQSSSKRDGLGSNAYTADLAAPVDAVRIKTDSSLQVGSLVIDAVALVSADGTLHWATEASATSDRRSIANSMSPTAPTALALDARARQLLKAGFLHDARLVAEFNVSRNPESWRVYATLARVQDAAGDIDDSIASLEQALDQDPKDRDERRKLSEELKRLRRDRR